MLDRQLARRNIFALCISMMILSGLMISKEADLCLRKRQELSHPQPISSPCYPLYCFCLPGPVYGADFLAT